MIDIITKIRKEQNMSVRDLSTQSGVSRYYIHKAEAGLKIPKREILKLSKALNITSDEIDDRNKYLNNKIKVNGLTFTQDHVTFDVELNGEKESFDIKTNVLQKIDSTSKINYSVESIMDEMKKITKLIPQIDVEYINKKKLTRTIEYANNILKELMGLL